jgi:NAD(P)-dependent dehydrogenase (short-subunit alcohol dehydrogenase family)
MWWWWSRRAVRDLRGRKVFLTGAASGIGKALAVRAAREGAVLHLTDVRADALTRVVAEIESGGGTVAFAEVADVSDHDAVRKLGQRLTRAHGAMDVVMNVAGISVWGTVRSLEHHQWRRVVDVNLMGPIHVIEALVPPMIDSGRGGHLVNVSSAAGLIGMPWHAAYSASKFGLRGVSEVLRFDLRRHGIGVSLVCPGAVATPLTDTIEVAGVDKESRSFRRAQAVFRRHAVTPERAADAILEGLRRGRYWIYTSTDVRLAHALQRYLPFAYSAVMRLMNWGANKALPSVDDARPASAA